MSSMGVDWLAVYRKKKKKLAWAYSVGRKQLIFRLLWGDLDETEDRSLLHSILITLM